jgi:hypothetical protein
MTILLPQLHQWHIFKTWKNHNNNTMEIYHLLIKNKTSREETEATRSRGQIHDEW